LSVTAVTKRCYYLLVDNLMNSTLFIMPIPVTARPEVWVCGRSLAGFVGSNSSGDMDIGFLRALCVVSRGLSSLRRPNHSSRGVLPSVVCLIVIVKPR